MCEEVRLDLDRRRFYFSFSRVELFFLGIIRVWRSNDDIGSSPDQKAGGVTLEK